MEYKGYNVKEENKGIIVENVKDFSPAHVFECGQCFRWLKQANGSYTGIAKGKAVNVSYYDGRLEIANSTVQDFVDIWFEYFDLGRDYSEIKNKLNKDEIMNEAIKSGYGIRLLKQDIWETLISFIISANNRIPRIMKTVSAISRVYGDKIQLDGHEFFTFPGVEALSNSSIEQLEACGGGFRCKYIIHTARLVESGAVALETLPSISTDAAKDELMKLPGVGPKVSDCVLLFSGAKHDVFPTDVWVKRVMEELYFKREASFKEIQDFAAHYFGELTGFAQQYLFYYARENKIGAKERS